MKRLILAVLCVGLYSCAGSVDTDKRADTTWQYYHELGMSSFLVKNYSEAIANFYKATQLAPQNPQPWNSLGIAYMEVREYDKAESAFIRALQADKSFTEAYLNMGILYYRKGDYNRAKEYILTSLKDETFTKKHMAYYYLAKVHESLGDRQEYVRNLERASAYFPGYLDAQIELANFYENNREHQKAADIYLTLLQEGQKAPFIKLNAARNLGLAGNANLAKSLISELLSDRTLDPSTRSSARALLDNLLISEHQRKHNLSNQDKAGDDKKRQELLRFEIKQPKKEETKGESTTHPVSIEAPSKDIGETIQREVKNIPETVKEDRKEEASMHQQVPDDGKQALADVDYTKPRQKLFRIQLGVFSNAESANDYKSRLEKNLGLSEITVSEKGGLYRVFYKTYESREEAMKDLVKLRALKLDGIIVSE